MSDSKADRYEPPTIVEYGELEAVTNGQGGSIADGSSDTPGHPANQGEGNGQDSGNGGN